MNPKDILELIKGASVPVVVLVVLAYFLKAYLEKRIEAFAGREDSLASRIAEIGKTSLDLKKGLRTEERLELLTFRVAVEKWEYGLQTFITDFAMLSASDAKIQPFYEEDKQLFLDVKIAVVKVSTYLRSKDLEIQLMAAISNIRNAYYPLIHAALPQLIELQTKMIPLELKLKKFAASGMQDMTSAPTQQERDENLKMEMLMTQEASKFSESLLKEYQSIAEQMVDLKDAVNQYIYRPLHEVDVDKD